MILLLGIINYIIISTARGEARNKEVGIRKVVGAQRKSLVLQFLFESVFMTLLCLPTAIVLVEVFLPDLNHLINKNLTINYFQNGIYLLGIIFITIITGLISGSYVSFYVSRFNPIKILNFASTRVRNNNLFRKVLIIVQLVIFVGLLSSTMIIYKQLRFFYNEEVGYNKDNLISLNIRNRYLKDHYPGFKHELLQNPNIENVSIAFTGVHSRVGYGSLLFKEASVDISKGDEALIYMIDNDYLSTLEVQYIAGRGFREASVDDSSAVILNQSAVNLLGLSEPLGKQLFFNRKQYKVIGITADFSNSSIKENPKPIAMFLMANYKRASQVVIRVNGFSEPTLNYISEIWDKFSGGDPIDYDSFDNIIKNKYQDVNNLGKIVEFFAFISISIAVLGLFGLSLFIAKKENQRNWDTKSFWSKCLECSEFSNKRIFNLNHYCKRNCVALDMVFYG